MSMSMSMLMSMSMSMFIHAHSMSMSVSCFMHACHVLTCMCVIVAWASSMPIQTYRLHIILHQHICIGRHMSRTCTLACTIAHTTHPNWRPRTAPYHPSIPPHLGCIVPLLHHSHLACTIPLPPLHHPLHPPLHPKTSEMPAACVCL